MLHPFDRHQINETGIKQYFVRSATLDVAEGSMVSVAGVKAYAGLGKDGIGLTLSRDPALDNEGQRSPGRITVFLDGSTLSLYACLGLTAKGKLVCAAA